MTTRTKSNTHPIQRKRVRLIDRVFSDLEVADLLLCNVAETLGSLPKTKGEWRKVARAIGQARSAFNAVLTIGV